MIEEKRICNSKCADCGRECEIPFVPKTDRPVYCSDCFRKTNQRDSGNERFPR